MKLRAASGAGFSLVELVATLIVVGILAAYAIPRWVDRTGFESRGFFDQAQGLVRYAQKIAIAQRQSAPKGPIYVVITVSQIRVCYDVGCASAVTDPISGAPLVLNAPADGAVTLAPVTTFSFSGAGAPSVGAQLAINVNSTGVGDANRTFYVEAVTGYVHD